MNNALQWAQADLNTGLAALSPEDYQVDNTLSTAVGKLGTLQTAKQNKLESLSALTGPAPWEPKTKDATIAYMEDADTLVTTDGEKLRLGDKLRRYDAAELDHPDEKSFLPQAIADVLPSWMPGASTTRKSEYAEAKQAAQAGLLLGKDPRALNETDVRDVGNMQQVQMLADLAQSKGQERWEAPLGIGVDQVALGSKENPLNLKVKIDADAKKDVYGRTLTSVYNAETGKDVTAMHAADPKLNAFAAGVPEPLPSGVLHRAGNTAKAFVAGAAGGLVDMADLGAELADQAQAKYTGKLQGWDLGTDEDKTKAIDSAVGYDRAYTRIAGEKVKNEIGRMAVEGVDAKGLWKVFKEGVSNGEFLGESLGYLAPLLVGGPTTAAGKGVVAANGALKAATLTGDAVKIADAAAALGKAKDSYSALKTGLDFVSKNAGLLGVSAGTTNDDVDEYAKAAGISKNEVAPEKIAGAFVGNIAINVLDRVTDVSILKGPEFTEGLIAAVKGMTQKQIGDVGKGLFKLSTAVGYQGGKEAVTEYAQTFMEQVNKQVGEQAAKTMMDAWNSGQNELERLTAGALGFTGAQQMNVASIGQTVAGGGLKTALGTTGELLSKLKPQTKEVAAAVEETDAPLNEAEKKQLNETLMNAMKSNDFMAHATSLGEIEPLIRRLSEKDGPGAVRAMNDYKMLGDKIHEQIMSMNADAPVKFGSSEDAEDALSRVVEAVKVAGKFDDTVDKQLLKIAKANNISEERYNKVRSAAAVEYEVTESKRGYMSYQRELNDLNRSGNADSGKVNKIVHSATRLYETQDRYAKALEAAIVEANKRIKTGHITALNRKIKLKDINPTIKTNWDVSIEGKSAADYKVDPRSVELLQSKRANMVGAKAALELVIESAGKSKLFGSGTKYTVVEYAGSNEGAKKANATNKAFIEGHGVTKVITGPTDKEHTSRVKYTREGNASFINADSYTEDDVVLISAQIHKRQTKAGKKGVYKTKDGQETFNKAMSKLIRKAMAAGATIIVDPEMSEEDKLYARYQLKRGEGKGTEHKSYTVISSDKGTKGVVYKTKEKATVDNEKVKATVEAKKAKVKVDEKYILDVAKVRAETLDDVDMHKGKMAELAQTYAEHANMHYKGSNAEGKQETRTPSEKLEAYANRVIDEQIAKFVKIAIARELGGDVMSSPEAKAIASADIRKLAVLGYDAVKDTYQKGAETIAKWQALDARIKGPDDADAKVAKKELEALIAEYGVPIADILENSSGAGVADVVTYVVGDKNFTVKSTKEAIAEIPKNAEFIRTRTLDPKKIFKTTTSTEVSPLAVLLKEKLGVLDGVNYLDLAEETTEALERLFLLVKPKNGEVPYDLSDSPARMLVINKLGEVEPRVALAMRVVLHEVLTTDGYKLSDKWKSDEDLGKMLGIDASAVTPEIRSAIGDKGMLLTTFANSLGSSAFSLMGMSKNKQATDVDNQMYAVAAADMGNMIALLGKELGILTGDEISIKEFSKMAGYDTTTIKHKDSKVLFVKLSKNTKKIEEFIETYKQIDESLPAVSTRRVEPQYRPIKDKDVTIRKGTSGMEVAKKAKEAVKHLRAMKWRFDIDAAKEVIAEKDALLPILGYIEIDSAEYNKLSYAQKDIQDALNREATKGIEELERIVNQQEAAGNATGEVEMYFDWDYIKSGRYMLDSNTINPQTNKQIHRFLVQSAGSHIEYKYDAKSKDVIPDALVYPIKYSLAQAFGLKVDKDLTSKIDNVWGKMLLGMTDKQLDELRSKLLEGPGKEYVLESGGNKITLKSDHIQHSLQAIKFMKARNAAIENKSGSFKSSLTAEFDAVTSGFGNKMLQMGWLIDNWEEYMLRVGIIPLDLVEAAKTEEGREQLRKGMAETTISALEKFDPETMGVNDLFGYGMLDSYQALASDMLGVEKTTYKELEKAAAGQNISLDGTSKGLWAAIVKADVLPAVTEVDYVVKVTSAMRNLFKYPFMIFNYAAAMFSLKKNLVDGMVHDIVNGITADESSVSSKALLQAFKVAGFAKSPAEMLEKLRNEGLLKIRNNNNSSLYDAIADLLMSSYGAKFEEVMNKEFAPFLKVQDSVNIAFKIMFESYKVAFDKAYEKLRGSNDEHVGSVTDEQYNTMLLGLRDQFPAIKGPLTMDDEEFANIAIYDEEKAVTHGAASGAQKVQTKYNGKDANGKMVVKSMTVAHKVRVFAAAIKAGSVVPYHFIDAAHITTVVNEMANTEQGSFEATSIHDALLPALLLAMDYQKSYNKSTINNNDNYRMLEQIRASLEKVETHADWEKVKKNPMEAVVEIDGKTKKVQRPVGELYAETLEGLRAVADEVAEKKEAFDKRIEDSGLISSHMAGLPDGAYRIKGTSTRGGSGKKKGKDKKQTEKEADSDSADIPFQREGQSTMGFDKKASDNIVEALKKAYPEVNIDYSLDEDGIVGKVDLEALKVFIDPNKQQTDTAPHEYAHIYINWFKDTAIVKAAIASYGSEEALVQAIGEQAVKQKGKAWGWWKKFGNWVKGIFNALDKKTKQELTELLTDAFLERTDLHNPNKMRDGIYNKYLVNSIYNMASDIRDIGTEAEYLEYTRSIFPDSKVQNLVSHKTKAPRDAETVKQKEAAVLRHLKKQGITDAEKNLKHMSIDPTGMQHNSKIFGNVTFWYNNTLDSRKKWFYNIPKDLYYELRSIEHQNSWWKKNIPFSLDYVLSGNNSTAMSDDSFKGFSFSQSLDYDNNIGHDSVSNILFPMIAKINVTNFYQGKKDVPAGIDTVSIFKHNFTAELIVNDNERIHVLGSDKDVKAFKKWKEAGVTEVAAADTKLKDGDEIDLYSEFIVNTGALKGKHITYHFNPETDANRQGPDELVPSGAAVNAYLVGKYTDDKMTYYTVELEVSGRPITTQQDGKRPLHITVELADGVKPVETGLHAEKHPELLTLLNKQKEKIEVIANMVKGTYNSKYDKSRPQAEIAEATNKQDDAIIEAEKNAATRNAFC